jgi:hypothetical protein
MGLYLPATIVSAVVSDLEEYTLYGSLHGFKSR